MLTFKQTEFKCKGLHSSPMYGMPMQQIQQTHFAGLLGESHIAGRPGGRDVRFEVWLNDDAWTEANADLLDEYVTELAQLASFSHAHGTVVSTGGHDSTLTVKHCTFIGFDPGGNVPLLDETGMIGGRDNDDNPIPVWWMRGSLIFRQAKVVK